MTPSYTSSSLLRAVPLFLSLLHCAAAPRPPAAPPTPQLDPTPPPPPPAPVPGPSVADENFLSRWARTGRFTQGAPTSITISPNGDAVFFLRATPENRARDLWIFDPSTRTERVLITAERILNGAEERLTPEERARRERMRLTARGITSYALSPDGRSLLIPLSGKLFLVDRATNNSREIPSRATGAPVDPKFSPDGRHIAMVRNGSLWITEVATGRERALVNARPNITYGEAEFVAQEEMDRMEGFWWAPDSRSIVFQETDVSHVEELYIADPSAPQTAPEHFRYPRAGRDNAVVRLGQVPITGGTPTWINWDRTRYPYLVTVRWQRNAPLTIVVENRLQTEMAVLTADARGTIRELFRETDEAWINIDQQVPRWLPNGSFLWSTERGGHRVLELRAADGTLTRALTVPTDGYRELLHVSHDGNTAYFLGGNEPTEAHIYELPLTNGSARALTTTRGEHSMVFAEQATIRAHLEQTPDHSAVVTIEDPAVAGQAPTALRTLAEEPSFVPSLEYRSVGTRQTRTVLLRPRNFVQGARYPVLVNVYGGPGARTVTAVRNRYLLPQWIADHGYIVVSIDGRGTPFRGREWERAIKYRMGDLPIEEQAETLQALGNEVRELDLTRVGIYGWSFGGYASALAVLRRPEVFHAAVAGAPVADWRDYDTHYTERFMGLPAERQQDYDRASVLTYANASPMRPLLIVHGTADDNVYFLHGLRLSEALFRADRSHEFLPLVGQTHMVADPEVNLHFYRRLLDFFARALATPTVSTNNRATTSAP